MGYVLNKYETSANQVVGLVQAVAGQDFNTSSSSGSISLDNTTVGNLLVVIVQTRRKTTAATSGWIKAQTLGAPSPYDSDTAATQYVSIYYKYAEGGTEQFSITIDSSQRMGLDMFEFAGATKITIADSYVFNSTYNASFNLPESLPSIICAGCWGWPTSSSAQQHFTVSGTIPTPLTDVPRQYVGYTTSAPLGSITTVSLPHDYWAMAFQLVIS